MGALTYKPKYVEFLISDGDLWNMGREMFPEWTQCKNVGIAVAESDGEVECRDFAKNMPSIGEGFGFLIIPMGYREENHFDEGYQ